MPNITKRTVDALTPGDLVWDSSVSGFGVRCQRTAKIYVLKYRTKNSRQRWYAIGKHGSPWTVERARNEARLLLGEVANGKDPADQRDAMKDRLTVSELCDRFLDEYSSEHKKPSSHYNDTANVRNHVSPLLGRLFIADVTRGDIDRFMRAVKDGKTAKDEKRAPRARSIVTGGPGVANKCLALLSKMFNLAEVWGLRPDGSNPCRHVKKYPGKAHERFLSEEELARLAKALSAADTESPFAIAAIRLLVFTGCRLGEILTLRWDDVNFDNAMLLLPDSKTGRKPVYLNAPALDVLNNLPRVEGNSHVICGEKEGASLVNMQKPWGRIRKKAGLDDVRIHDLRHSFASVAAAGGASLPIIGALLGHRQSATTARYAHLAADPLKAANEAIGQRIAAAMKGEGAEVVQLAAKQN